MQLNENQQLFFELLKAGLWGDVNSEIRIDGTTDWNEVYQLAQEQSVQGLVLQGIDSFRLHVPGFKIPQLLLLQWIGEVKIIEQQNKEMNVFIADLIEKLRKYDIYAILVKGQGIAQCYDKPLWRSSGDVDLLLSDSNYEKAKKVLIPLATSVETEYAHFKHQGMTIDDWVVELHGTLHSRLSKRVDKMIDKAQRDVFNGGNVRCVEFKSPLTSSGVSSSNLNVQDIQGTVQVFLPAPNEDVIFVFTHILHHFYIEGIGVRQLCDWCRLLWTYRESLDHDYLESKIREAGLMSEWKAFYNLASRYLGMPDLDSQDSQARMSDHKSSARFMFHDSKYDKKADRIMEFVLESGNFGQNREYAKGKLNSAWSKAKDFVRHIMVFPVDSVKFFVHFLRDGLILIFK